MAQQLDAMEGGVFQSTLPAWGETALFDYPFRGAWISIHSPRVGRDAAEAANFGGFDDFNPLSPRGERPLDRR